MALGVNVVVQAVQIGAYAARLAGVITGRIATSISLFNLFVTASRLATLVYTIMLGPLSDHAGHAISGFMAQNNAQGIAATQHVFEYQLRLIIVAGTLGVVLGTFLLPMFTYMFERGVRSFERTKSLPHSFMRLANPIVIGGILRQIRLPRPGELQSFSLKGIPRRLLIFNVVVTGVYAIGVVAAYYASVLDVTVARTAIGISGVINGIGTVAFTFFVDPTSSIIVDEAVKGERPVADVKSMVFYLSVTALVGWILSQAILWPGAELIRFVAHLVYHGR